VIDFFRRALGKLDRLDTEQQRELLVSAVDEINLLENVLDSIDVGIFVCDENHNLVKVNKFAHRLLPLGHNEGVHIWHAIEDERIVEFVSEALLNRDRIIDKEIDIFFNGRKKLLSVNILPLVQDRKITGSLICIYDITEKRKGESRLRRAENLAALTTLAAGVAHEIKNPLGSISIHLQLLQKVLAKANHSKVKTDKYLDILKEEVDRLNKIVVDFLFAVRPMTLDLREGDINKLISKMMEFIQYEMEQSNIECRLELEENLPKILIDERLLKQALLNLVKNAQSAMPRGGTLTVSTNCTENEIKISIHDTGNGISEENISKIFEPYFSTSKTGTGLGLTLVFKIIREHHGEISVISSPGEGAVFEITLPIPQKETRLLGYIETGQMAEAGVKK
jgi:PAS domain S-box-containing protein